MTNLACQFEEKNNIQYISACDVSRMSGMRLLDVYKLIKLGLIDATKVNNQIFVHKKEA